MYIHTNIKRQTMERRIKNPAHDIALATDRNVDAMSVAVTRFINVATLIAFTRIIVEKTSDGTSQAPLKNERNCNSQQRID